MKYLKLIPCFCLSAVALQAQEKPNVIIIVADDAGYADFGFMGSTAVATPSLDALAGDGVYFTDAHTAATVSSPSRAMLLTGRYGHRFGYECNTSGKGEGLPIEEQILPQILKKEGYLTACIGKWHLGEEEFQHPNQKGFDEFYGLVGGSRNYWYNAEKDDRSTDVRHYQHNGTPIAFDGYFTDELTSRAKDVITTANQPFMMYLSYTAPHSPNQAKPEDLTIFEGNDRKTYAAMLYALDRGVGEIVSELKRTGKYENTLIFFLSDNGGATTNGASNLPLKGFKGNKFEGGHRVPFVVAWGEQLRQQKSFDGLTSSLDIFATVVDAAGIKDKKLQKRLDGVSLLPYVKGKKKGNPHQELYWRKMDSRAIRDGEYKLIMTQGIDTVLYKLNDDGAEMRDLKDSDPKKTNHLLKKLSQWEQAVCITPKWIEDGWGPITNGYHQRLMRNEIFSADDLKKKKK